MLFYDELRAEIARLGGYHNAHLHLDRAHTLDPGYVDHGRVDVMGSSAMSLQKKHALIRSVHDGPAYDRPDLLRRVDQAVQVMIATNTRLADTVVDVTDDRVGTQALQWIMEYAQSVRDKVHLRAASYTPLGFRDDQPGRWEVFEKGAEISDFLGSLPEADDRTDYPDNIGYEEHCRRVLEVARRSGKLLHVHTDQFNHPNENGTERLIDVMRRTGRHDDADGMPLVWAVHMISPSTYPEPRWRALVEGLLECNIGLISCPSAAIGMRQIRAVNTPAFNSIPRLLELAAAGVPIRIASDNIADMCSPSTTADLGDEVFMLSAALRFYHVPILAKFAAGVHLDADDRALIAEHLEQNDVEMAKAAQRWA